MILDILVITCEDISSRKIIENFNLLTTKINTKYMDKWMNVKGFVDSFFHNTSIPFNTSSDLVNRTVFIANYDRTEMMI